jgi:hypothetical protein
MVARGEEPRLDQPRPAPPRALNVESVAQWLKGLYSEAEFRALAPGAIAFEARQCGCYDRPTAHYPYLVAVLSTPKGDLILRPDQRELQVSFVHLALRQGDLYCGFEPGGECHGRFADVCDFTDFRYGDDLAPYFPTCKSGDD